MKKEFTKREKILLLVLAVLVIGKRNPKSAGRWYKTHGCAV